MAVQQQLSITLALAALTLATLLANQATAQTLKPIDPDQIEAPDSDSDSAANASAKSIYALTKGAKTGKQFTKIVEQCELALERSDLPDSEAKNIKPIYSWALNRRGKKRLENADALRSVENIEQADVIFKSAMEDFGKAVEADPKRWQSYLSRGIGFVAQEKYKKAASDFTFVTVHNPKKSNGWFNRAETYYAMGQFERAIKDYGRCLKLSPFDVQAFTGRAHAKFELGRYKESLADYEEAVRLAPEDAMALANRGVAHQLLGDWEKAYADYVECVKLKPGATGYQKAAWMLATCPDEEFFRPESALDMANKAIRMEGDSLARLETLAAAKAAMGDFAGAKKSQTKAIELANGMAQEVAKQNAEEAAARLKMYEDGKAIQQDVNGNTVLRTP